jgi:hypothetical protein
MGRCLDQEETGKKVPGNEKEVEDKETRSRRRRIVED